MKAIVDEHALAAFARARVYFSANGKPRLGVGQKVEFDPEGWMEPYSAILGGANLPTIGSFSYTLGPLPPGSTIGRYCSISSELRVMAGNHPMEFISTSSFSYDDEFAIFTACLDDHGVADFPRRTSPSMRGKGRLSIGNDVWIGQSVLLGRGMSIGHGAVVGAASVVTKPVAPYAVVAGNPARLIRYRFPEQTVERLLALEWWRFKFPDFADMPFDDVERFLGDLEERVAAGRIVPFEPPKLLLNSVFALGDP